MYIGRASKLLLTYAVLWVLPSEKVDLCVWRNTEGSFKDEQLFKCGSTACAIGWMTSSPVFQAIGFTMDSDSCQPFFEAAYGWEAVADFFDVTLIEAMCLFQDDPLDHEGWDEEHYQTIVGSFAKDSLPDNVKVLRRIREFRGGTLNESRFFERQHGQGRYAEAIGLAFDATARRLGFVEFPAFRSGTFQRPEQSGCHMRLF